MRVAGRDVRFDRMTVGELEAVERTAGCSVADIVGPGARPTDLRAVLAAVLPDHEVGTARVKDLTWADVPTGEGLAVMYVAVFGCEPWCWPPDVTRRQLVGDLDAILQRNGKEHR